MQILLLGINKDDTDAAFSEQKKTKTCYVASISFQGKFISKITCFFQEAFLGSQHCYKSVFNLMSMYILINFTYLLFYLCLRFSLKYWRPLNLILKFCKNKNCICRANTECATISKVGIFYFINSFLANVLILYPFETPKN